MQNKHQIFFLSCWCPNVRGGGGGQAGWDKIPSLPKSLEGSPKEVSYSKNENCFGISEQNGTTCRYVQCKIQKFIKIRITPLGWGETCEVSKLRVRRWRKVMVGSVICRIRWGALYALRLGQIYRGQQIERSKVYVSGFRLCQRVRSPWCGSN